MASVGGPRRSGIPPSTHHLRLPTPHLQGKPRPSFTFPAKGALPSPSTSPKSGGTLDVRFFFYYHRMAVTDPGIRFLSCFTSQAQAEPPPRPERSPRRLQPPSAYVDVNTEEGIVRPRPRTRSTDGARPEIREERGRETLSETGHSRRLNKVSPHVSGPVSSE